MLIPDNIRKCVVFLFFNDRDGNRRAAGTGFFVSRSLGDTGKVLMYLLTARHVIANCRIHSGDGRVLIRANAASRGIKWQAVHVDRWHVVDDDPFVNDVATVGMPAFSQLGWDHLSYPFAGLATDEVISEQSIGLGDEVVIAGLFVNHHGQERNTPIVRIGNIAAMPEEPISTKLGSMDAYLIEARSIGGLSGSPVFVNVGIDRSNKEESILLTASVTSSRLHLLGVTHGHWDVEVTQEDAILSSDGSGQERVNMGIAIVSPASKVVDLFELPEVVAVAKEKEETVRAQKVPTIDAVDDDSRSDSLSLEEVDPEDAP